MEINFKTHECNIKIVYYGPGLSGKTTNLQIIHKNVAEGKRGKLTALATDLDHTLFFDYMPIDLGKIGGMNLRLRLFTVPGQVYYNAIRKLVLRCVDGIVFVADSQEAQKEANKESLQSLKENLAEAGLDITTIPLIIQYNKRDLANIMSLEQMEELLNRDLGVPSFPAVAVTGDNVEACLKAIANKTIQRAEMSLPNRQLVASLPTTVAPFHRGGNTAPNNPANIQITLPTNRGGTLKIPPPVATNVTPNIPSTITNNVNINPLPIPHSLPQPNPVKTIGQQVSNVPSQHAEANNPPNTIGTNATKFPNIQPTNMGTIGAHPTKGLGAQSTQPNVNYPTKLSNIPTMPPTSVPIKSSKSQSGHIQTVESSQGITPPIPTTTNNLVGQNCQKTPPSSDIAHPNLPIIPNFSNMQHRFRQNNTSENPQATYDKPLTVAPINSNDLPGFSQGLTMSEKPAVPQVTDTSRVAWLQPSLFRGNLSSGRNTPLPSVSSSLVKPPVENDVQSELNNNHTEPKK